jgi:hypothetical protein
LNEVLDHEIDCIVCVFNAQDGDVVDLQFAEDAKSVNGLYTQAEMYLIDETREDNHPDITPQVGFELQTSLAFEQQILSQIPPNPHRSAYWWDRRPCPWTSAKLTRTKVINVVLPVVELAARIADMVPAVVAVGFEDVASLEENLHNEERWWKLRDI